jgi:hypothetical protein
MWVGDHRSVVTTNGIFRPFVLSGGRARGIWRLSAQGIEIEPLEPIDGEELIALVEDARDVYRFLGREVPPDVVGFDPGTGRR